MLATDKINHLNAVDSAALVTTNINESNNKVLRNISSKTQLTELMSVNQDIVFKEPYSINHNNFLNNEKNEVYSNRNILDNDNFNQTTKEYQVRENYKNILI